MSEQEKLPAEPSAKFISDLREKVLDAMQIHARITRREAWDRIFPNWHASAEEIARGQAFLESYKMAASMLKLEAMLKVVKMEMPDDVSLIQGIELAQVNMWAEKVKTIDTTQLLALHKSIVTSKTEIQAAIRNGADLAAISSGLEMPDIFNKKNYNFGQNG